MATSDVVICGAGITGIAVAYHLSRMAAGKVIVVDERPPMTLTSERSTECYRNWWPDGAMLALTARSIDLMEALANESGNAFAMNRRGYLYVTADAQRLAAFRARAERISAMGAGDLRIHSSASASYQRSEPDSFRTDLDGADLLLDPELILANYPGVNTTVKAALHVRRAGWLSAQQLGMYLLAEARARGVELRSGRVESLTVRGGQIRAVGLSGAASIPCTVFVNAGGPHLRGVAAMAGIRLPIEAELHLKAAIQDGRGIVDRAAPLLIWDDPQVLPWDASERDHLFADPSTRWLTELMPGGVHTRPEGGVEGHTILILWAYRPQRAEPVFPPPIDPLYPEVALRGLSTLLPGLRSYFEHMPRPAVDGGYYIRTPDSRPLVGLTSIGGFYIAGAVAGYGIMAACAVGELLAACILERAVPQYAAAFDPRRFDAPGYLERALAATEDGQL